MELPPGLAEHLALRHDLSLPTESQRLEREARHRQRADADLHDELREFLRDAREFPHNARAVPVSLGFGGTVAAILCALLLFPVARGAVAWMFEIIGLLVGFLVHRKM